MRSKIYIPVLTIIILLFVTVASQSISVMAEDSQPLSPEHSVRVWLPKIGNSSPYSISGRVTDEIGNPVKGVNVSAENGESAVTNSNGNYTLNNIYNGPHYISPEKSGLMFNPAVQEITVNGNLTGINFNAIAYTELIVNGGFEDNSGWVIPVTEYKAGYSTTRAHNGSRSMRTGIVDPAQNKYSYSATNQKVTLPSGTINAQLYVWLFPLTGESSSFSIATPQEGSKPDFSEATESSDAQYVLILDANGDILETLVWMRSNNGYWTQHEFNLTKWAGRTIQIHIGTYNNGGGGVTTMYADDVSLLITSDSSSPPTTCGNSLTNSNFESNTGWNIPATAYTAGYSTMQYHSAYRSMRTGIIDPGQNKYSYSDAWQYASIPTNAINAKLKIWYLPKSGEVTTVSDVSAEAIPPPIPQAKTIDEFYNSPVMDDAQYLLVLDTNGNIIDTLIWIKSNSGSWKYTEIDLMKYKGKTIRLQFGTQNDGTDGVTGMYVDDMYVDWCTGDEEPPITTCTNLIKNGGFENNNAWIIPTTNYSAGYSTYIYRSGVRSMRTGIYYQSYNRYSYSDTRQSVNLPGTVSKALLSFYIYPRSNDTKNDVQYVLILDQWGNWIDTLVWQRTNQQAWLYKEFSLKAYAGETIQINFGTYNDGSDGVTSMYVDDVRFEVCP
jgi:hypothetical protein